MANEQAQQPQDSSLESYGYKQEFSRVLKLRHLVLYGLAYVTPTAPFPMLGIVAIVSVGHLAPVYLVAMFALFFTATSYGKMAARHPIAGSAYSYSQQAIHPHFGFVIGWALFLTYILVPLLSVIAARDLCLNIAPSFPSWLWIVLFVVFMTAINFFGIKVTAGANAVMTGAMIIAAALFVLLAVIALTKGVGEGVLLSTKPFYNPATFNFHLILAGSAIGVFSYIGFDGVSTLAEEVENPRVNIGRATVLVCIFCAVIFVVVAYLAQMVWPDFNSLPRDVSAVLDISERIGGQVFRYFIFLIMIVAGVSCALAGQVSAARIMYGMGRDGVLPRKFFSYVSKKYQIPSYNLLLIAVVSLVLAFLMNFEIAAQVLNYGAFLGFFAVNLSVIFEYAIKHRPENFGPMEVWRYILMPVIGMLVCGIIFMSLDKSVLVYVSAWMAFGLVYYGIITRGFSRIVKMKIEEE
ncbi:MAG: APC family permease [Candidatus Glassbacteria bacterium]|nr:APC family permease [Candidatus Glassbacteria bacterium]